MRKNHLKNKQAPERYKRNIINNNCIKGGKGNVDQVFFDRIKVLLKIAVPSYKTKEFLYLVVLTGLLVVRTYMSIWLADVNG